MRKIVERCCADADTEIQMVDRIKVAVSDGT